MIVKDMLAAGQLNSALSSVEAAVRKNPLDYRHRTALFSLLCLTGELDRAEQQLQALGQEDEMAAQGAASYRQVLQASRARDAVLRGDATGSFLLNEPAYAAAQRQVLKDIAGGRLEQAAEALQEVAQLRPACPMRCGEISGLLRDADDRLAPFAELFVQGEYVWLPWEQLRSLRVSRPVHLRDLIWVPVVVELEAGPLQAFMPVLYPQTCRAPDELTRLGRMTTWRNNDFGLSIGQGARLLAMEVAAASPQEEAAVHDLPLLEIQTLIRQQSRVEEMSDDAVEESLTVDTVPVVTGSA